MIRRFLNVLRRLSLNCREASQLIAEAHGRKLSRLDRVALRLHLMICRTCRAYRHSIRLLNQMTQIEVEALPARDGEALPAAARERILHKLRSS